MAKRKSFFDDVKNHLECSVCQEQFSEINEPKILKCLHTFCKTCLEAWLRQQREGELSCPTCRQITKCSNNNINSLPSNLFCKQLVEIVEAYTGQGQDDSPRLCGNCEKKKALKFYCFDCNFLLCEECVEDHRKWENFSGHEIKKLGNFKSSDVQDYTRRANVCKKHKDELRFYCEKCKICICRDCAVLEHRDDRTHNIISLEQGLENKKSDITQKMQDVETIRGRLRDQKDSLVKRKGRVFNSIDQAADEVHRVAEQWISLIRQHESTMTKELLEQKENFQAAFSAQITSLDERLMEIDSSLEFGKDVLERQNLPEIVNVEGILERRFQELSSTSEFRVMPNYPAVKYVPSDMSSINNVLGKLLFSIVIEPSLTIVRGKGLTEGTEGEDCTFTIITKDLQGQTTYCEFDKVNVDIQSLETGNITKPKISDSKNGRYEVKYKPEAAGEFSVSITVGSEAITGSPFQLQVKERMRKSKGGKGLFRKRESSGSQSRRQATRLNCDLCKYVHSDFCDQSSCGHHFCKSCQKSTESLSCCPVCDAFKDSILVPTGNQPKGHMSWRTDPENSLPGFHECGTINISCNFERGVQGPEHPNPGVPYRCFSCTFYLPDNREGRDLCILLRRAFNNYLMFTVGSSSSAGAENRIVCNGLELKSNRSGGPANCGYPDSSYLYRLKKQLAEKGIK